LPAALVPIVQAAGWSVLALLLSLISCIALWSTIEDFSPVGFHTVGLRPGHHESATVRKLTDEEISRSGQAGAGW
jgi:hypothetical protein